ncbi:MAG: triose-phosphate isomerase [Candidatus Muirbacterium halophilum]|nr:triose-phosphate isomerase [Candidatus Muirbacterium halophilum]MCK9475796.1 triose-phosphate isomerase [Candidatus Muirbacterium halophilum]
MRKIFIAGNWKMNNTLSETKTFIEEFKQSVKSIDNIEIGIAPSFVNLAYAKALCQDSNIKVIAQNMYFEDNGAYTGEISPLMLKDINIDYVIIGHSERRQYFGETEETVNKRIRKAFEHNIKVILCIGEKLQEREQGITNIVLEKQLKGDLKELDNNKVAEIVIAYEPVWAIGTGKSAKTEDAQNACNFIRKTLKDMFGEEIAQKVRIQYGGSVKAENSKEYMSQTDIDGALVGGASLKADSFSKLIKAV